MAYGGCTILAPPVAAATAGVGGVVVCGLSVTGGVAIGAGGVLLIQHAFTPWHNAEAAELSGPPSAAGKE